MENLVELIRREHVAILEIRNLARNNQLSSWVLRELRERLLEVRDDRNIRAAVITGQGVFSVGANVDELYTISRMNDPRKVQELLTEANEITNLVEHLGKPTVASIRKFCLGGGNELAMACTIRVAAEDTKFGQPEIKLGIIPGMGGTQRLPRLVGVRAALPILLSGNSVRAADAAEAGLVDVVPEDRLNNEVLRCVSGEELERLSVFNQALIGQIDRCEDAASQEVVDHEVDTFLAGQQYQNILSTSPFPEAVSAIVQAVREGMKRPLAGALQLEQEWFTKIVLTDSAQWGLKSFLEKHPQKK